jgi:hypothetical protein
MLLQTRIQPLARDVDFLLEELTTPAGRSLALAEFARSEIAEAKAINRQALGREPPSKLFVDGRQDAALESVRPDGTIVLDFQLVNELLFWIHQQLEMHSPSRTGRYKSSHALFADGTEVTASLAGVIPQAEEYVFINTQPYARKIERGSSSQAPEGVYQVVAVLAQRQFRNVARITFSFRTVLGGRMIGGRGGNRAQQRNPAIVIKQRT